MTADIKLIRERRIKKHAKNRRSEDIRHVKALYYSDSMDKDIAISVLSIFLAVSAQRLNIDFNRDDIVIKELAKHILYE